SAPSLPTENRRRFGADVRTFWRYRLSQRVVGDLPLPGGDARACVPIHGHSPSPDQAWSPESELFGARIGQCHRRCHAASSLACGSLAWGKPCFPHEPPSSGVFASTPAPLRSPRTSKSSRGETSRFPPAPSTRQLTLPPRIST